MTAKNILVNISLYCFIIASVSGLIASLKIALPAAASEWIDYRKIRPLHTFLALAAQLSGLLGLTHHILGRYSSTSGHKLPKYLLMLFIISGSTAILAGCYSGREYITWPSCLSLLLLAPVIENVFRLFRSGKTLSAANPEGFWLLVSGHLFIIGGLIESHYWMIPVVGGNIVRDITVQWHGIDTFIAGINIGLYGVSVFLLSQRPKPLRNIWLYAIALFSLLFTFGHHHYISPQPLSLKILAFAASMVAVLSFLKHSGEYRKQLRQKERNDPLRLLINSVTLWMLVSIGTGVLFAVPHVNLFVHGTYWIVAHAMGAMIGTNMLIVILGSHLVAGTAEAPKPGIKKGIILINTGLLGLWLFAGAAGLVRGAGRVESDFIVFSSKMEYFLRGLPFAGLFLIAGLYFAIKDLPAFRRK